MRTIEERAMSAAWSLGHGWLGPEHLLVAVLSGQSASAEALRSSRITAEEFAREIEGLSERYIGDIGVPGKPRPVAYKLRAQRVLARAEGLAAGFGSRAVTDDHVLLALLWERIPSVAERLLERRGITRADLLVQLDRRGVQLPAVRPPKRLSWGPWMPVPPDEAVAIGKELHQAGTFYRLARRGDEAFVATASNDLDAD